MAGVVPFFITGANAKIKLNGVTLAFCTNLSYSISVVHATPTLLGMYEAASLEPRSYKVSGQLAVIRYANSVMSQLQNDGFKTPPGVSDNGNGIGSINPNPGIGAQILTSINPLSTDGRADQDFDPSQLQTGTFFDIEVYQKMPDGNNRGVARLRSCRLTRSDFSMQKKTPAMQVFSFDALYADEDSFLANFSGTGQQFS
jgi:hypothetical protein